MHFVLLSTHLQVNGSNLPPLVRIITNLSSILSFLDYKETIMLFFNTVLQLFLFLNIFLSLNPEQFKSDPQ